MAKRRSRRNKRSRRRNRRKRGSRRHSRRRRKQRGGGAYGFNPKVMPNWGKKGINWRKIPNTCGTPSKSNMNAGKQYAPLVQAGGGLDSKGLGHSLGGGGQISYGYGPAGAKFAKDVRGGYAPITRKVRPQCGSGKRRKRQRRSRRRRNRRSRNRRSRNRRSRNRRRQRGGYHQYQSNKPFTPSYAVGGAKGNWSLANPPPFTRTDNCVDNYNHYKKSGSPSPVLDQAAQY